MSSVKTFVGRKRESLIWIYIDYNEQTGEKKCCVVDVQTGKECGTLIAGKNWMYSDS